MIRRNVIKAVSAVALLAATACVDDPKDTNSDEADSAVVVGDAGNTPRDASTLPDATVLVDSATSEDADIDADVTEPDASAEDAGVADATALDATLPDATALDATTPDATLPDATLPDATLPDAGTPDASLPALAAHYRFDENTGTTSADSTGAFGAATLVNSAGWTTGVSGSALSLTGTGNKHVTLPVDLVDDCADITIAMWMKLGAVTNWSRLLEIDGAVNGFLFFTPAQDVAGAPHLYFNIFYVPPGQPGSDQGVSAPYPTGTVLVNEWHHVAFTLAGGTGRLYFDGAQIGAAPMAATPAALDLGANAHAWIGRSMFPDPYLNAAIDDLRVSCTAYSAAQVAALAD